MCTSTLPLNLKSLPFPFPFPGRRMDGRTLALAYYSRGGGGDGISHRMESMTHPTVIRLTKGTRSSSHAIDGGDEGIGAKADAMSGREAPKRTGKLSDTTTRICLGVRARVGRGFVGPSGDVSLQCRQRGRKISFKGNATFSSDSRRRCA